MPTAGTNVFADLAMAALPCVSVVVLNWNGRADTIACLESLGQCDYRNLNVIVVDNGSTDGSAAAVRAMFPAVEVIETGCNLGFAEGNNVGIRHALERSADFVMLLNNDTVVDPPLVSSLVRAAQAHPDGGIFSGKIFYFDAPSTIWYAGARWRSDRLFFEHVGERQVDDGLSFEDLRDTDYASGCAFFVRARVLREVGLLDPRFFLTYEESDFCYRARSRGYRILYVPDAKLWHKVSVSFGGVGGPLQSYFYSRNVLLWAERHLTRLEYLAVLRKTMAEVVRIGGRPEAGVGPLRRHYWAVTAAARRLRQGGSDAVGRARFLGVRDYFLRRFGDCPAEVRQLQAPARP